MRSLLLCVVLFGCAVPKTVRVVEVDCRLALEEEVGPMSPQVTTQIVCRDGTLVPCGDHPLALTESFHLCSRATP